MSCCMDVRPRIAVIEPALAARGISVAQVCRKADVAPTTWLRWKSGTAARARNWDSIVLALKALAPGVEMLAAPEREAA